MAWQRRSDNVRIVTPEFLSAREREVLRLLAHGHTNRAVAARLQHLGAHRGVAPGEHEAEAGHCRAEQLDECRFTIPLPRVPLTCAFGSELCSPSSVRSRAASVS